MSAALKTTSVDDYLAAERAADFKSDYFRGDVFAMSEIYRGVVFGQ